MNTQPDDRAAQRGAELTQRVVGRAGHPGQVHGHRLHRHGRCGGHDQPVAKPVQQQHPATRNTRSARLRANRPSRRRFTLTTGSGLAGTPWYRCCPPALGHHSGSEYSSPRR
jgi:hypothetical protein